MSKMMQRTHHPIQTITRLAKAIANPATGDWIFIDLDHTVLLPGLQKYQDEPSLTESELLAEINRLRERGIHVVGLTSRKEKYADTTREQLSKLGIVLNCVVHAQDIKDGSTRRLQKCFALNNYLSFMAEGGRIPRRIFVIDNLRDQLDDIAANFSRQDIPLFLKHYQRPQYETLPGTENNNNFPADLTHYEKVKSLGGGTESVFLIQDKISGKQLVLKYGAHEEAGKLEILCNAVYQALGVTVPDMRIYNTLPRELAKSLNLQSPYGMFKVCEVVNVDTTLTTQQVTDKIKTVASHNFVAHALLGNIDVAKQDNFMVADNGMTALIDAGANFILRAKGEVRIEDPSLVSEIDSLRDASINPAGSQWFANLTDEDLAQQMTDILRKQREVEAVVWQVSQQLNINDECRNRFLQCLSDRIDILVTRFSCQPQTFAKMNKKAIADVTAAGIFTYTNINGEPHILLSKRVRHEWWDNFGGKSEAEDGNLLKTARREVAEESGQKLNYTDLELQESPCHDIVTGKRGREQRLYRMYISQYDYIDPDTLKDDEHTAHQWVPLKNLIASLDANDVQIFEGQETKVVQHGDNSIPLYPPLLKMLQQQPVRSRLNELLLKRQMKCSRTLSYAEQSMLGTPNHLYRPLQTPSEKRQQIAAKLAKNSCVVRELKRERGAELVEADENAVKQQKTNLSQSEIHLKAMLGNQYQNDNLVANVRAIVRKYFGHHADQERLIQHSIALIEKEKSDSAENIYFYHACSNSIAFAYDVYTAIYQALQQDATLTAFRPDSEHFKRFMTINEFIAFYSNNGAKEINNNAENYNECTLSANVFLFGNHLTDTSCSINYLVNNDVRRQIDLPALFSQLLSQFQVSTAEISRLLALFQQYQSEQGGVMYQIAMPVEQARNMSYPSGFLGVMNKFEDDQDLPSVLQKLQDKARAPVVTEKDQAYISRLQARVMVPPQLKLVTQTVKWQPLSDEKEVAYRAALAKTTSALVHKILCHHSALNSNSRSSSLLNVLPSILRSNQISYTDNVTDVMLARAILASDVETVRSILKRYPALLNKHIAMPHEYFTRKLSSQSRAEEVMAVADMIILRSTLPLDVMIDFNDKYWPLQLTDRYIKSFDELYAILKRLPSKHRLMLVKENLLHVLVAPKRVVCVFDTLPIPDRDELAHSAVASICRYHCVTTVASMLESSAARNYLLQNMVDYNVLFDAATYYHKEKRLAFLESHTDLIVYPNQLCMLLTLLPGPARLQLATRLQDKITNGIQIRDVLSQLEGEDRDAFLLANIHKCTNIVDLVIVAKQLDITKRMVYITRNTHLIKSAKNLADVLKILPSNERVSFADSQQDKFALGIGLDLVLMSLDQIDRYAFAIAHKNKLQSINNLEEILREAFEEPDRLMFALANTNLINSAIDLRCILSQIPAKDQLAFIDICATWTSHAKRRDINLISCQKDLFYVLYVLDVQHIMPLVLKYLDLIDISGLCTILELLPAKVRVILARAKQDIIIDADRLDTVVTYLPIVDRLVFIRENIKNASMLAYALDLMLMEKRLCFAMLHQSLITTAEQLQLVMQSLPEDDQYTLVAANIKNYETFTLALRMMPVYTRTVMATAYQHFITSYEELGVVLDALNDSDRLIFARSMMTKLQVSDGFSLILARLDVDDRFYFAMDHLTSMPPGKNLDPVLLTLPEDKHLKLLAALEQQHCADDNEGRAIPRSPQSPTLFKQVSLQTPIATVVKTASPGRLG